MSIEEKLEHKPVEEDVTNAAATLSEVSGNKKAKSGGLNSMHLTIGIVIVVVAAAMFFSSGHTKVVNRTNQTNVNTQDYNQELAQNMEKLKKELATARSQTTQFATLGSQTQNSNHYKARQNQPTSMYSAPPPNDATGGQSANAATTATFSGNGTNVSFGNQPTQTSTVSATAILHPHYTIASGEVIHAALETAINSDLPGMVRAVITDPVYAYVGERPLIPAGSRLIGQYSSAILQGQDRIMIIWERIVLPNGIAIQIDSPGADALGEAGQGADSINTHFCGRFGEAALLSIMGAGAATYGVNNQDQYNSAAEYRSAIAESFQQSAQNALQDTLPMKPTLHIYQGAEINVFVAHDLSFYNVLKNAVLQ